MRAFHIYTRTADNNTAIDRSADINDVEYLWRKRFGIHLSAKERLMILLDDLDKWVFDWGNKKYSYHIDFPEFQIVQAGDMQQGWWPSAAFYTHPIMHIAPLNIMFHSTIIYETELWSYDQLRKYLPKAENCSVAGKWEFWYSYYLLDSIKGKLLKLFTQKSILTTIQMMLYTADTNTRFKKITSETAEDYSILLFKSLSAQSCTRIGDY